MSDEKPKHPKPRGRQGAGAPQATPKTPKPPKGEPAAPKAPKERKPKEHVVARLAETYKRDVIPLLIKRFKYKSPMQVPRLRKWQSISAWERRRRTQSSSRAAARDLEAIVGQKVVITRARNPYPISSCVKRCPSAAG